MKRTIFWTWPAYIIVALMFITGAWIIHRTGNYNWLLLCLPSAYYVLSLVGILIRLLFILK